MSKILVVEDEQTLRNSICRYLSKRLGVDTVGVGSVQAAQTHFGDSSVALVILDLQLPDGYGLDLLPLLAAQGRSIAIILITAHYLRFADELPRSSNISVLQKPFEMDQLCALVRERFATGNSDNPRQSAFTVADYLQLAAMARRSIELTISAPHGHRGMISVVDGDVRWASDEQGEGIPAFQRLALMPTAEVRSEPLVSFEGPSNVSGALEQLLLDAARVADEQARSVSSAASLELSLSSSPPASNVVNLETQKYAVGAIAPPPPIGMVATAASGQARAMGQVHVAVSREPTARPAANASQPVAKNQRAVVVTETRVIPGTASSPAPEPKPKEEHEVTAMKIAREQPRIADLIARIPTLRGVARTAMDGSVLESTGDIDAETTCAVATLAAHQIAAGAAELGLGDLCAWQLSTKNASWYVVTLPKQSIVAVGEANKNAVSVLKKIQVELGVQP